MNYKDCDSRQTETNRNPFIPAGYYTEVKAAKIGPCRL
jgi:hypothetical protein